MAEIVGSDNTNRLPWPLARVLELIPGTDGVVRLMRLKTATGEYLRPIQRLYPMKVGDNDELLKNLKTEPAEGSPPSVKDVPDDST